MRATPLVQHTLIGLGLLIGCASGPANTLAPGYEGAPGVERLLVCAPNTVITLPAEFQSATRPLREQIDAYLRFHDRKAQWLDLVECKREWTAAINAAKEHGPIEKTPVFFAQQLDARYDFDAIVMPSLLVHAVRTTNGYAWWDGVQRHMRASNVPDEVSGMSRQQVRWLADSGPTGDMEVTSFHVIVFSRAGERIFEGRGGIDFASELDLSNFRHNRAIEMRLRDDLPGDRDALREAIAIGFAPFLPMPPD
jgi:hypothetical protein